MSVEFCDLFYVSIDILIQGCLLQMSMSVIIRHHFIFVWKRVHGIDDSFVARFVSCLSVVLAVGIGIVNYHFGQHRGVMWFICVNEVIDNKYSIGLWREPGSVSYLALVVILLTIIFHLVIMIRLSFYKLKW